jgi:hypothetical protein
MRSSYLPWLIVGCALIYLSLFGLVGPQFSLPGTLVHEDFDSLPPGGPWFLSPSSTLVCINPAGQLQLTSPADGSEAILYRYLPSDISGSHSYEAEVKFDTADAAARFTLRVPAYGVTKATILYVYLSKIQVYGDNAAATVKDISITNVQGQWYNYTVSADWTTGYYTVFRDDVNVGQGYVATYTKWVPSYNICIGFSASSGNQQAHCDHFYMDLTTYIPPAPSTKGTIHIQASYYDNSGALAGNASGASVSVTKDGQAFQTFTTDINGFYSLPNLDPGTYAFSGTYKNYQATSASVTISDGEAKPAQLNFYPQGTPPITTGFPDIIGWINSILQNPNVKQLLMYGGIAIAAISSIMLLLPEKKPPGSAPPPWYRPW